jgi:AraC-like DNA-binding protein
LSAEFIAGRLGMSARSLQRLFEREGLTFSGFVTGERLARAHNVLGEDDSRSIAEIAMDCGFGDISYFNRKFRARYHAAPSDVRNGELRSPGQIRNGR